MFEKGSKYYADYRDAKGKRVRKSFATPEAAKLYEVAKTPKRLGKHKSRTAYPSRQELRVIASYLVLTTPGPGGSQSRYAALCNLIRSVSRPCESSTEK